ncbi:MAG TPA: hypothetical protein VFL93_10795 [Longimicrobiaceae bacterium]|nr:hypothetical protein [Longimicrobiaceae bacterium]
MRDEHPQEPQHPSREDDILRDPVADHLHGRWLPIQLSTGLAAYLLWLITRDLAGWSADRPTHLTREEACDFAEYLYDGIPNPQRRSEVPRRRAT